MTGASPSFLMQTIRRKEQLPSFRVDDSVILLDRENGSCYALNATGSRIWDLIAEPVSIDALCQTICTEFSVDRDTCERDVTELVDSLRQAQLAS